MFTFNRIPAGCFSGNTLTTVFSSKKASRLIKSLGLSSLLALSSIAMAEPTLDIRIQGNHYQLALDPKTGSTSETIFFRGRLIDELDSWATISRLDGRWQGVVSLAGELYSINSPVEAHHRPSTKQFASRQLRSATQSIEAEQINNFDGHSCGLMNSDSNNHRIIPESFSLQGSRSARELNSSAQLQSSQLSYSSLCSSSIDGICMLAKLEIVADLDFQNKVSSLGGNPSEHIQHIVNIVEDFYRNDLSIGFDTVNVEMLESDNVLINTRDANTLLNDLHRKRIAGGLHFEKNPNSIMHLLTGRDIAGTTLGIAKVGAACLPSRSNGLSELQTLRRTTHEGTTTHLDTTTTAIIMAHEIGHNMDSDHDDQAVNGCDSSKFIMGSILNLNAANFSKCSVESIQNHYSSVSNPASCLSFPVDSQLIARSDNPDQVDPETPFKLRYDLTIENAYQPLSEVQVLGSLPADHGRIISVWLDGKACLVTNGLNYSCSYTQPLSSSLLEVEAEVFKSNNNVAQFSHEVLTGSDANQVDVVSNNNRVVTTITVTDTTSPAPSQDQDANPLPDNTSDEPPTTAPNTEDDSSNENEGNTDNSGGGGSSGGGSAGVFGLLILALSIFARARRRLAA